MDQQDTALHNANVLNVDMDADKIKMMVKELALFCDGKEMSTIEVIFALDELAGRLIVRGCGGHPLVAANLKQAVQRHLDNVVKIGFQATYAGGTNGETPRIITSH